MPSRPSHYCPRCRTSHGPKCPKRKAYETQGQRRGNRHQRGYGSTWDKLRKTILTRDKHLCQVCLAKNIITPAEAVDHITPKAEGGTDDPSNLRSICKACHAIKTAQEGRRGRGV